MRDATLNFAFREDVPAGAAKLAKNRTRFLIGVIRSRPETSFDALLASAYLQGMDDAIAVLAKRTTLIEEPRP